LKGRPPLHYHAPFARGVTGDTTMLNVMRDNLRHLKWILVVVALAMLFYLGSYFDKGTRRGRVAADWAAKVDGQTISTQEFLVTARSQDDYYHRLLGSQYEQMKKSLKVGSAAIQTLVDRQLVLTEARGLGLTATKDAISKAILENPSFKDASGNFVGKDQYAAFVAQNYDGGVEAFERQLGYDILAKRWLEVMTASARISDAELEAAWRKQSVRSGADYVFVPSTALPADTAVDAATLAAWYGSHQADYRRSEGRKVKLVVVDRQAQAAAAKVTDAEVKADYDAHAADYQRPEQRRARHILFKIPPSATEADKKSVHDLAASVLARAQKGEDFAAMAKSLSQDTVSAAQGGELGWFARGAMVKAFDDAAFTTPPGSFAPVVETEFGYHVLQVEEARPAGTTPFAEVADSIRRRLELTRAQDLAAKQAQALAASIKTPADLDAAAAKAGLKVEQVVISPDDRAGDLGPSPEFMTAVAALQAGQVAGPLGVARGLAIVSCTEVVAASVRPLSEVQAEVKKDVLNDRARQAALVTARRIAAAASLADGAKAAKLEVKKTGDLTAGSDVPGVGHVPELDTALFGSGSPVGTKGAVVAPGGAIAYAVTRHDTFDPAKFAAEKGALAQQLLEQRRNQLAEGLIQSLRQRHTIEINQELVNSVNG
jgi:peptidyl-prolyl cis-trans isomerase D